MYYLYGMLLLRIEPRLLGITNCSLVTTDYANGATIIRNFGVRVFWFIQWKRRYMKLHNFNTIIIPGLQLLFSNLRPYRNLQLNGRSIDCDRLFLHT
jgi:hypothetical protein